MSGGFGSVYIIIRDSASGDTAGAVSFTGAGVNGFTLTDADGSMVGSIQDTNAGFEFRKAGSTDNAVEAGTWHGIVEAAGFAGFDLSLAAGSGPRDFPRMRAQRWLPC